MALHVGHRSLVRPGHHPRVVAHNRNHQLSKFWLKGSLMVRAGLASVVRGIGQPYPLAVWDSADLVSDPGETLSMHSQGLVHTDCRSHLSRRHWNCRVGSGSHPLPDI